MIALRFLPQGIFGKEALMLSPEKRACWQALQRQATMLWPVQARAGTRKSTARI